MTRGNEEPARNTGSLPGQRLGSLIGAVFGLIYIEANAGALPRPAAPVLRIAGAVIFAGLVVLLILIRRSRPSAGGPARGGFGRKYWLVVAAELAAIVAGSRLITGPFDLPHAAVAWISIVVGVHFFALAAIWRISLFRPLGAAIALCGIAGLAAAADGAATAVVAAIGGLVPGALLLAAGYWGAARSGSVHLHSKAAIAASSCNR